MEWGICSDLWVFLATSPVEPHSLAVVLHLLLSAWAPLALSTLLSIATCHPCSELGLISPASISKTDHWDYWEYWTHFIDEVIDLSLPQSFLRWLVAFLFLIQMQSDVSRKGRVKCSNAQINPSEVPLKSTAITAITRRNWCRNTQSIENNFFMARDSSLWRTRPARWSLAWDMYCCHCSTWWKHLFYARFGSVLEFKSLLDFK